MLYGPYGRTIDDKFPLGPLPHSMRAYSCTDAQGAVGWEAFSVGGREMLAVANIRDDETGELTSPNRPTLYPTRSA